MRYCLSVIALATWLAASLAPPVALAEAATVFAAASLTNALEAIADRYRTETGARVRLSFAASSTLARQIEAGAPAQIFASANERWMDRLAGRSLVDAATRVSPIGNRLVLIAPAGTARGQVEVTRDLDLGALLGPGGRLAVGDPAHVPAGLYAKQALQTLGLWAGVAPRLARADNTRAALALVARGEAPLGIVYATDAAITDRVRIVALLPAEGHPPIAYPAALVGEDAGDEARAFLAFLRGAQAQAIFRARGFTPPPAAGLDPAA